MLHKKHGNDLFSAVSTGATKLALYIDHFASRQWNANKNLSKHHVNHGPIQNVSFKTTPLIFFLLSMPTTLLKGKWSERQTLNIHDFKGCIEYCAFFSFQVEKEGENANAAIIENSNFSSNNSSRVSVARTKISHANHLVRNKQL